MLAGAAAPHPALASVVDRFWWRESLAGLAPPLPELLPGSGAELFFHFRTPFHGPEGAALPQAHLVSLRQRRLQLVAPGPLGFIAVRLRSGMLHRVAPVQGRDVVDGLWSAQQLWGAKGLELGERIALAPSMHARIGMLERFLLARQAAARTDSLVERAAQALYGEPALAIDALAARLGIGCRQLERRFKAVAGISPVRARRLGRLQKLVRSLLLDAGRPLLDAVLEQGYFDQAHFHHDFTALAGIPAGDYLARARSRPHFYQPSLRAVHVPPSAR